MAPTRSTIVNSIVAGNTAEGGSNNVNQGSATFSANFSLLGTGVTPSTGSGNLFGNNPALGYLANNGGPTQTHALLPGSPAIDAGSNALAVDENGIPLSTDQRGAGFDRIQDDGSGVSRVNIGAFEGVFLLGDVNQDGMVDFDDISPFISLLSSDNLLNHADTNRDGEVDFNDISSFISLLATGGRSARFSSSLAAPVITEASAATSTANAVVPFVSSAFSAASEPEPESFAVVAATAKVRLSTRTFDNKRVDADTAKVEPNIISDGLSPQVSQDSVSHDGQQPAGDPADVRFTPVDTSVGPTAVTPSKYRFLGARASRFRSFGNTEVLVPRSTLTWDARKFDLPNESRILYRSANVSTEQSISTAAELFDAHPESLEGVFGFELEETLIELA